MIGIMGAMNIELNEILKFINDSFKELDKFIFRDKKYVINKQLFKLYWSLEALKILGNEKAHFDLILFQLK